VESVDAATSVRAKESLAGYQRQRGYNIAVPQHVQVPKRGQIVGDELTESDGDPNHAASLWPYGNSAADCIGSSRDMVEYENSCRETELC